MTLCIAAGCHDWRTRGERSRIVFCADHRIESDVAGGDIGLKYEALTDRFWVMFAAEDVSKARDFANTCRTALANASIDPDDMLDKLNEVSAVHKKKLCQQLVARRLGMDWDRFLRQGKSEISADVRTRTWREIESLDYECELLVFGFARREHPEGASVFKHYIFRSEREGEFKDDGDFSAIGSGRIMAEGNLFFRGQDNMRSVEQTLYNVFESASLAYEAKAPGVGETKFYMVAEPGQQGGMKLKTIDTETGKPVLEKWRKRYGPKPINKLGKLTARHFYDMREYFIRERGSASDSQEPEEPKQ